MSYRGVYAWIVRVVFATAMVGLVAPAYAQSSNGSASSTGDATTTSGDSGAVGNTYNLKLREIEEKVSDLKERIFQSKARLMQLQEVVLYGTISGAKAILLHRNEMGGSFKLVRVQYALDGSPIFNRVDTDAGELAKQDEIEIFNGSIAPGNHQISVYLEYAGHGYGLFSYLNGYRFKIKSSYTFDAEEGKVTTVKIVGYEKGGFTTHLQDRPAVRYDIETARALRQAKADVQADNASDTSPASAP